MRQNGLKITLRAKLDWKDFLIQGFEYRGGGLGLKNRDGVGEKRE